MSEIKDIMKAYGLDPLKIDQITDRVYKVSDGRNTYALKESRLTRTAISTWEHVYHYAHAFYLTSILPVYLTSQSDFYTEAGSACYYLTPWVSEDKLTHEQMIIRAYETIANIHAKTSQQTTVDIEAAAESFGDYRNKCAQLKPKLLNYIQLFERKHFMSPFELQVCTHYHVLLSVLNKMDFHLDNFMKALEANATWSNCLCHGHLDLSHFINHGHTYLINWENATFDTPVTDVSQLLHSLVRYHDQSPEQLAELFSAYTDLNTLTGSQHHLLSIYLLDPFYYLSLIEDYLEQPERLSMVKRTQKLELAFRQLTLGLKWIVNRKEADEHEDTADNSND